MAQATKALAATGLSVSYAVRVFLTRVAVEKRPEYLDHSLTGDWADRRECHTGGDFLLVYKLVSRSSNEDVIFVRASAKGEGKKAAKTGRHAHL